MNLYRIKNVFRALYRHCTKFDSEVKTLSEFAKLACGDDGGREVLDVGCGYGRNMKVLAARGFDVSGVDANEEIVAINQKAGLHCLTIDEFNRSDRKFDLLLMSHVIEHFPPTELVAFMDSYLDRLRPGGHLLIATPLSSSNFYDDFDHVRPYQPIGLLMVFGGENAQVQYYARNRLELCDIWFRRSPLRGSHFRARYIRSPATRLLQAFELGGALAFRASFGLIGRTDGWVGLFRKMV